MMTNTDIKSIKELADKEVPYDTLTMYEWIQDAKQLLRKVVADYEHEQGAKCDPRLQADK